MAGTSANPALAVYCGSSAGMEGAYHHAAISVGRALAEDDRPLVYGGGSRGIMGTVSGAVLEHGGKVTGIVPYAMVAAGGEGEAGGSRAAVQLNEAGREKVETIVVNSMHERKVEMAQRVGGFIGLPGGFGTFEEILEVTTWSQIGIHSKPVVVVNVLSFWEPLRALIQSGVTAGFIQPKNASLILFVDGPSDHVQHATYDWGEATLDALKQWKQEGEPLYPYNWKLKADGTTGDDDLKAT